MSAQGPAEVAFIIEENRSTSVRSWEVVVADQRAVVSQDAAVCTWSVSPAKISADAAGGEAQAVLTTEDFCSWELQSPVPWIAITPDRGLGIAEITVRVSRNTGRARVARVAVPSAAIEVAQREAPVTPAPVPPTPVPPVQVPPAPAPPVPNPPASDPPPADPAPTPCAVTLRPDVFTTSASGGSASVSVDLSDGCAWTVSGTPTWITVSPTSGTGSATLNVAAAANSGPARTAMLSIGGREFRVEQASLPPCTYAVTPDRFELSHKKQQARIDVTTLSQCQWSATSSASWLRVPSGARTGGGTLDVKVEDYSKSGARSAVVTVSGENFSKEVTVTQAGKD